MDPNVLFFNFLFVYIEINMLCVIISMVILLNVTSDMANSREVFAFKSLVVVYIFMLITDSFTQLTYRHVIAVPALPLSIIYIMYQVGFGIMAFYWFRFLEFRINPEIKYSKWLWALLAVPLAVLVILNVGSIEYGWLFTINDEGIFQRGPLFMVQTATSYIYFVISAVHAIIESFRESSPTRRQQLRVVAAYVVPPAIGALLQMKFSTGLPILAPSISICVVFMYVNIQKGQVHHDALTGLENRRSLDIQMERSISRVTEGEPFYLYMMDVNDFKKINDTYGHTEGDKALKIIAEALESPQIEFKRIASRYGGDEFAVIIEEAELLKPGETIERNNSSVVDSIAGRFLSELDQELKRLCDKNGLDFDLSVTAGYAKCSSNLVSPKLLVEAADNMLYEKKREYKFGSPEAALSETTS